jgi:hypothetical protein
MTTSVTELSVEKTYTAKVTPPLTLDYDFAPEKEY